MSLANLMPGEKIDVELRYTELMMPTARVYEMVFPTVVGSRYSSQSEATAPSEDLWVKSPYITNKAWKGTCRKLSLRFSDGTTQEALFQFN